MTRKRYKKLLMSTGIQRNMAERLTVWGRQQNLPIDRTTPNLDAFRIGFLYDVRHFAEALSAVSALTSAMVIETATNVLDASNFDLKQFFEGGDPDV